MRPFSILFSTLELDSRLFFLRENWLSRSPQLMTSKTDSDRKDLTFIAPFLHTHLDHCNTASPRNNVKKTCNI
ncbi:hypothetical protein I308_103055 [Cryptococcus tetragattii IND107]|uniref:Uncharacterized protein n=1 Tax=Cryptococcus tetragattii IND107 TaxID=1296105 RepID=A0ABR3BS19_9TREE